MAKKRKSPPPPEAPVKNQREEEEEEEEYEEIEVEEEVEEVEEVEEDESSESEESAAAEEDDDEESDESSKREALRKLLEPFTKDQLIDLIKQSALENPSINSQITTFADSDPAQRKIFVYGLSRDVTTSHILQSFSPFGEIDECRLITDKLTGLAKGYAFVVFQTRAAAKSALKESQKTICGRSVSCQLASVGPVAPSSVTSTASDTQNRKIYVGNVGPNVNPDQLRDFFAKFGEIEEGPMGFDHITNKSKGFAIFVFKTAQGCSKALEEPMKSFEGCKMYCKKFIENNNANKNNINRNQPAPAPAQAQMGVGDVNYALGVNQGIINPNLNMGALLMAQNQGLGLAGNPMMGSFMKSQSMVTPGLSGIGGNYGVNNNSLNQVMGSYNPQASLQGLGAYQSPQLGQSSADGGQVGTTRGQSSTGGQVGSTFPSYFGH